MSPAAHTHMVAPGGPRPMHRIHKAGRFDIVEVHRTRGVRQLLPHTKPRPLPPMHRKPAIPAAVTRKRRAAARVDSQASDGWLLSSRAKEKSTLCKMQGSFIVPEMPREKGSQLVYLSLGVEGTDGTLRTALQWGFNGGSGGQQWGFACWYEELTGPDNLDDNIVVMSCLEPIEIGDKLDVTIARKTAGDHTFWECEAVAHDKGPEATLRIVGDMSPNVCVLGLEMYQADLSNPAVYPGSQTHFSKPELRSSKKSLEPHWKTETNVPDTNKPHPDLSVKTKKNEIVLYY